MLALFQEGWHFPQCHELRYTLPRLHSHCTTVFTGWIVAAMTGKLIFKSKSVVFPNNTSLICHVRFPFCHVSLQPPPTYEETLRQSLEISPVHVHSLDVHLSVYTQDHSSYLSEEDTHNPNQPSTSLQGPSSSRCPAQSSRFLSIWWSEPQHEERDCCCESQEADVVGDKKRGRGMQWGRAIDKWGWICWEVITG